MTKAEKIVSTVGTAAAFVFIAAYGVSVFLKKDPPALVPGDSYDLVLQARATSTRLDEVTLQLAPEGYGKTPNASAFLSMVATPEANALFAKYVAERKKFRIKIEVVK